VTQRGLGLVGCPFGSPSVRHGRDGGGSVDELDG